MLDYSEEQKNKPCPRVDCRLQTKCCSCGLNYIQIPAALGDDSEGSEYAPENGAYVNKIVEYEANGHVYIYGSDGIPVSVAVNIDKLNELVQEHLDSIDLQEEVNNKIDEMVESGTLQRILNSPATTENIGGVIIGDGLNVDENGKIDVKAGSGITVNENGVSETPYTDYLPIDANETDFIDADTATNTHINYSIIPNTYKPKIVMSDSANPNNRKKASEFDYIHKPTLMTNLSPWNSTTDDAYGPLIIENSIEITNNLTGGTGWTRPIIGIDDNGIFHNINGSTSADNVNYPNAFRAWYCLYNDGSTNPDLDTTTHEPRTFLAQDYNGNYLIGVCGGRKVNDTGMTYPDIIKFIRTTLSFEAKLIYSLDGGGSSNFLYHGIRQNKLVDRTDRDCPNWLVWSSSTAKHDGMFKNQSVNNLKDIDLTHQNDGHLLNRNDIISKYTINELVTINPNSRMFQVSPRILNINISFTVTGDSNLSAYSYIIEGLPHTFGNVYFPLLSVDTGEVKRVYINQGSDSSALRNRDALAPGAYVANLTLIVDEMY